MKEFIGNAYPTIGVEQEFHLIDPVSAELTPRVHDVACHLPEPWRQKATCELFRSIIETQSAVCRTVDELAREIVGARLSLDQACRNAGVRLAAAGSHPFSDWRREQFIQTKHYTWLKKEHGYLIHQMLAYGLHIHIGMPDGDCAVYVMNEMRRWLYPLLGFAANSPYQQGMDTDLHSTRLHLFLHLPRTGLPPHANTFHEVEDLYNKLLSAGDVIDPDSLWWLIRPQPVFGTLELRIFDLPTDYRRACTLAAITQAAASHYCAQYAAGTPPAQLHTDYLLENQWKAMRFGLDGRIIEPESGRIVTIRSQLERLLDLAAPQAARLHSLHHLEAAYSFLDRGNEASWQRDFAARHHGDLRLLELEIARRTIPEQGLEATE